MNTRDALAPLPDLTATGDDADGMGAIPAMPTPEVNEAVKTAGVEIKDQPAAGDEEYRSFILEMSGMAREAGSPATAEIKPIAITAKRETDPGRSADKPPPESPAPDRARFAGKNDTTAAGADKTAKEREWLKRLAVEPEVPPLLDIF